MPGGAIRKPRSSDPKYLRDFLRRAFVSVVGGCAIQGGDPDKGDDTVRGWPCRTCFFDTMNRLGITGEEAHAFWLLQLRLRDDGSYSDEMYRISIKRTLKARLHELRMFYHQRWGTKLRAPRLWGK